MSYVTLKLKNRVMLNSILSVAKMTTHLRFLLDRSWLPLESSNYSYRDLQVKLKVSDSHLESNVCLIVKAKTKKIIKKILKSFSINLFKTHIEN